MSKKKDKHITYDDPNNWTYNYAAKQEKDDNEREEMAMSKKSAGSTINWIKGAVVCTVVLVLVVIFINLLTVRVPAGYAAVQYNMNGGVQDKSLGQGWHIKSPFVKTTLYTVGLEQSYLTASKKGDSPSDESLSAAELSVIVCHWKHLISVRSKSLEAGRFQIQAFMKWYSLTNRQSYSCQYSATVKTFSRLTCQLATKSRQYQHTVLRIAAVLKTLNCRQTFISSMTAVLHQ